MSAVAWIVAIQEYAGPELRIPGQAGSWALDLARIMLQRGIEKIVLNKSWNEDQYRTQLEALQALSEERGATLVIRGAEQADIQNALGELKGTESLLLYWVGHGVITPKRQMVCANSENLDDLNTFDLPALLYRLRDEQYAAVQMGFFECCAQDVDKVHGTIELKPVAPGNTLQLIYQAASVGVIATGTAGKPGFSSTVLEALKNLKTFPPERPQLFFDALKKSFDELDLATRPTYYRTEDSFQTSATDDPRRSGQVLQAADKAGLSASQFDHLWQAVSAAGIAPMALANAFRDERLTTLKIADDEQEQLRRARERLDLEREFEQASRRLRLPFKDWLDAYSELEDRNEGEDGKRFDDLPELLLNVLDFGVIASGQHRLLQFLTLAARRCKTSNGQAATALHEKMRAHSKLGPLYESVKEEMHDPDAPFYLIIDVDWIDDTQARAQVAEAWISPGLNAPFYRRKVPSTGDLAARVNSIIERAKDDFNGHTITTELLLPTDLLCAPRKLFELSDETWLEEEHAMTFRWRDRIRDDSELEEFRKGTWKGVASTSREKVEKAVALRCAWRPGEAEGVDLADIHIVGLSFTGPAPADRVRNKRDFTRELKRGAPYMCWPRNVLTEIGPFKGAAEDLFGRSQIRSLPEMLRKARSNILLQDLILLMDDPDRIPPCGPAFEEVAQQGAS